MLNEIIKFLLGVIAVGGGGGFIAYKLVTWLGQKWIESKFAQELENIKHDHNQEIEELKFKINSLFNRTTKIHEKEFDVLPEAWRKLQLARGHVSNILPFIKDYPDLNKMTKEELSCFLENSPLNSFHRSELSRQSDKNAYYQDIIFWYELSQAKKSGEEFHNYLVFNKIFLTKDLSEEFKKVDYLIQAAIIDSESNREEKDRKLIREAYKSVNEKMTPLIEKIEELVQQRLHFQDVK